MTKPIYLLLLLLVVASIAPFLSSLNGDFVFDDSEAIVKNKDVSGKSWKTTFRNDFWGTNLQSNQSHKSYRPLTTLSFRLNYFLSGKQLVATHFKITNLLFHSICCILAWFAFRILLEEDDADPKMSDISFLTTLLFCVHPIHVESVSGIVGRADILAAIAFILAFIYYHKSILCKSFKTRMFYFFMLEALASVSMLCKENGVTVLGLCFLYEFSNKLRRKDPKYDSFRGNLQALFIVLGALTILFFRWKVMGRSLPQFKAIDNPAAFADDSFTKVLSINYVYFLNILLLIWPQWLCYDWSMGCVPLVEDLTDYRLLFIVLMQLYGIQLTRNLILSKHKSPTQRHIWVALVLLVVPFLPAANLIYPVGFVIAERILYIPSAGFCLLVVVGLTKIIRTERWRKIGLFFYCLLLVTFAAKSWHRSRDWTSEYKLFTSALSVCPLNAKVHYNVAKVADAAQNTDWAVDEYEQAIRLYPEYYQAMNNLANILKNQEKYAEAESYLRRAVIYKQEFPAAWMNLGIVLANMKRYQDSQNAYKMALKYRKEYPDCYYNLGNLNLELNNKQSAIDNWSTAIKMSPKHNQSWTNLLALLDNTDQLSRAMELIPQALNLLPDSPSVNFAIANIYGKKELFEDAEKHFLKAIELFGGKVQPIHYSNLGVLYHRWKKYESAKTMYQNALKIDPAFKSALQNLRSLQNVKTE